MAKGSLVRSLWRVRVVRSRPEKGYNAGLDVLYSGLWCVEHNDSSVVGVVVVVMICDGSWERSRWMEADEG